jgi:predicted AAA+ superfamily ATPase
MHLFGGSRRYASLDLPDVRAAALADPRGFLKTYPPPAIFDEVQHAPELLPYVKEQVDLHRDRPGQYLLTGSQNLMVLERVTESLAGRAAVLRLLPLAYRETAGRPDAPLPWERPAEAGPTASLAYADLWKSFLRGGYPELVADPSRDIPLWHAGYVQTYLERDVRAVRQIGDLTLFQSFLRAMAIRSGQLLNVTQVSRDLGVAVNTVKAWLSVLEATFQVILVRPYFANIGKRMVKSPKVYFLDVGTLCYLVGLRDPEHAASGPMAGAIFETAVLAEIVKTLVHRGEEPQVYF